MRLSPLSRRAVTALSALALVAVSACDCKGGGNISKNYGVLNLVWRDAASERQMSREATYDFGYALVGDKKPMTLTVYNSGAGSITLQKLELASGDATVISNVGEGDFRVDFKSGTTLGPSEQVEFSMAFTPRGLKSLYESHLTLTAEGTRTEDATAAITLKGTGEKGSCELPETIDFGKVPVGETLPWPVDFNNPTNVDTTGLAGDITGADATAFGYDATSPHGTVSVPAKTSVPVLITFSPTEKRAYTASVQLKGPGPCDEKTVTLKGEGSDDVLTWTPSSLNYGFVSPGFDSVKDVLFTNLSNTPITLTQVTSSMPSDFQHQVAAGQDNAKLTIPGGSTNFPMHIACSPAGMGPRDATLTFATPLKKTPSGLIKLKCTGGGPKIKVTPRPTLAFGRVGFFPGNANFTVVRKVNVQNVGTASPTPDPTTHLYLGVADFVANTTGGFPFFEIEPANATTDASEFEVSLAGAYDAAVGLQPVAGKNYVDIAVTLKPNSVGLKAAKLTINSNDSAEPAIVVNVTADVQQLPPCNYRVSPAQANFGLVTPPNTKDLPITITNLGTGPADICYLSGIDLTPGTSPAYSIVGGPVVEKELQPAESWQVVVRVSPPGPVPTTIQSLTGIMQFNVSSPTTPQAQVPLSTAVGPVCLAVTPDPLDFGSVKIGCNSRARDFSIYNICNAPVTLTGFAMQAAGGQPAGGPNCPAGGPPCPEFRLTSTPTIPAAGLVVNPGAAPVTFQVRYAPIDTGSDQGAVSISAIQGGQSLSYLVGLAGTGDTSGLQTDTFTQAAQPQADILLVVDDSGSMSDKQTNLANNFNSFIQYAQSAGVDYHLAIITTSTDEQTCPPPGFGLPCASTKGGGIMNRFTNGAQTVGPVITKNTANLASAFAKLVKVGTDGSGNEQGLETAVMALTPPRIAADNVGFLRTDANLAIVVVSDADDQSNQAVSYYQNRLVNVKGFNRLSMFTFSDIGPYASLIPSNCSYDTQPGAPRYEALVTYTGGVKDEICTTNWAGALQNLGKTAFGYRTQFFLNNVPDTTGGHTIEVQINGQTITQSTTTWSYDSATNSIKFDARATPGPGQTLTVTYTNTCF